MSTALAVPPAVVCEPPGRVGSYGDDVAELAERIGRPLVPEQMLAVDVLTAHDRRGRFLSVEAGIEVGRQNGKTSAIIFPIILWSALTDPDEYLWTAHMADTTAKAFLELVGQDDDDESSLLRQCPWLAARVRTVVRTHGNEGVQFVNGATLGFRCRSAGRGRGLSGTCLVLDETLMMPPEHAASLLPILATRSLHGNARVYYASSSAARSSAYLRSVRRRAVAGDPTLTYVGWWARGSWAEPGCVQDGCMHAFGTEGCALDDEARWAEGNPLLGRFTSVDYLRGMRRQMDPVQFGREFMGWQEEGDDAVDVDRWSALGDRDSRPLPHPVALGMAVSPGQKSAAVVLIGRRADGLLHVELKEHEPGTAWLGAALKARQGKLGVPVWHRSGRVPEAEVVKGLAAAGVRLEPVKAAEWTAACGELGQVVEAGGLRHLGDPRWPGALAAVVRRDVGDGAWEWTWRGSHGDASPAMAVPVALHGLATEPPEYDLRQSIV